jgi:hypothetical protein
MKPSPGEKRAGQRGKKLPDAEELKAIAAHAEFGEDAENPLLWQLLDLKMRLEANAKCDPGGPTTVALANRLREGHGKGDPMWRSEAFMAAVEQAVLNRDAEFFREVARLLETHIAGPHRRIDLEVSRAFYDLCDQARHEERELPTKREVREAALYSIALEDYQRRHHPLQTWEQMHEFDEEGVPRLKPEFARAVRREIDQFPEQNWTRIFKRCGLDHLAEDKGGRRSKRSSKRKTIDS